MTEVDKQHQVIQVKKIRLRNDGLSESSYSCKDFTNIKSTDYLEQEEGIREAMTRPNKETMV